MGGEHFGESYNAESAASGSEQASEVFREQQAAGAAQQAHARKQEASARVQEDRVAAFLRKWVMGASDQELMLLLSRCLEKNIPAGFLVGILALIEEEAEREFELLLGRPLLSAGELREAHKLLQAGSGASQQLTVALPEEAFSAERLPPQVKAALATWAEGLFAFARLLPGKTLATTRAPDGTLFLPLAQLTALVLKKYLGALGKRFDAADMREFAETVLSMLLNRLAAEQGEMQRLV